MSVVNRIFEEFFPQCCALCGLRSYRELPLCRVCEADLRRNDSACSRCAMPLPGSAGARVCGACLRTPPGFDRVIAPWIYTEHLAHLVQRWKYQGETRLTQLFAHLLAQGLQASDAVDVILPVPLHWLKLLQRGYNQSDLLARRLYRLQPGVAPGGVRAGAVRRCRATRPQSGMDAVQRQRNLRDAFTCRSVCDSLRVAVLDDVMTTGATASYLAHCLRRGGAAAVDIWCLARTPLRA